MIKFLFGYFEKSSNFKNFRTNFERSSNFFDRLRMNKKPSSKKFEDGFETSKTLSKIRSSKNSKIYKKYLLKI